MRFADINGQKTVVRHFQTALQKRQISHAYLLHGEDAEAGQALAEAFAQALLCENPQHTEEGMEPCGTCRACVQMQTHSHPDLFLAEKTGTGLGIDRIREIRKDTGVLPYQSNYKIYILPEADTMTVQAQNALLKTLEEPPVYVVLLLLSASTERFLPTVLSRLTPLRLASPSVEQMREKRIRREDAQEEADFFKNLKRQNFHELLSFVQGKDAARIFSDLEFWVRDLALTKTGAGSAETLLFAEEIQYISQCAAGLSYASLERILSALSAAKQRLDAKGNADLIVALCLLEVRNRLPEENG